MLVLQSHNGCKYDNISTQIVCNVGTTRCGTILDTAELCQANYNSRSWTWCFPRTPTG